MSNSPAYGLSQLALDLPNTSSNIVAVSTSGITRLYIDPNGNVGIGTTVPLSVLDVGGQANFQNNVTIAGNIIVNNITSNNSISFSNLTVTGNVIAASFQPTSSTIATNGMFLPAVNSLGLATNGSERMRIDANGALDVSGIASFRSAVSVAGAAVVSSLTSNGAISGSSITTGTLTSSGNLTFTGTGNRITGDFSNSPVANRVMFQTSTLNGQTNVYAIPNGSSTTAAFSVSGSNDPDNAAIGQFLQFGGTTTIRSVQTGTGSYTPITFWTSGSESMRIDTSGNVGIGISSPSTYGKLAVSGNMYAGDTTSTADGTITIGSNGAGSVAITRTGTGATNSAMTFSTTYATLQERMRIDSLGNVGIGTSTPGVKVDVAGSVRATQSVTIGNGGGTYQAGSIYSDANWGMLFRAAQTTPTIAQFRWSSSSDAEYMRIDASGNMLVGKTAPTYTVSGVSLSSGTNQFAWSANSGSTVISVATPVSQYLIAFYRTDTGALMGGIANGASNTVSYNTSSDHRLKEKVTPMTVGLATISALKPVTYDWVGTNENGEGFIAHELQEVIPLAVTGEKDAVNEDGTIKPQGVDYSKIVVHLVAACQEQQKLIVDLQERLAKAGL